MAFIERFSKIVKGDLLFVGNTLGLSKDVNTNTAGKVGSIGCFVADKTTSKVETFPQQTTLDYLNNSSSAVLNLPIKSEVLYAELVWSGLYKSKTKDIKSSLSKPIFLTTPKGIYDISAEYRTKQDSIIQLQNLSLGVYVRTCNVTDIVKKDLSGTYTVGKVPSIIEANDEETNKTNFAGWTLIVAFKDNNLSPKKLNVKVGLEAVYNNFNNKDVTLTNFACCKQNLNTAKVLLSAGEGDAELDGDSVYFGENENMLQQLSSPNNPKNNFFGSQINNSYGEIQTSGTFNDRNHDLQNGTNIVAGRQGYDITTIDVLDKINKDATTSMLRFSSTKDLYFVNSIGFSVDVFSANLKVEKFADKQILKGGDLVTYTVLIQNIGEAVAKDIVLEDCLPKHLTFLNHSISIDGTSYRGTFPIVLSNLNPQQKHEVVFKVRVDNKPVCAIKNIAKVRYNYESLNEQVKEDSYSNLVCLYPEGQTASLKIEKSVDKKTAYKNDVLTYSVSLTNISNKLVSDITFLDVLTNDVSFVNKSVFIDGVNYVDFNPIYGFMLGSLNPNDKIVVTFKVKIK